MSELKKNKNKRHPFIHTHTHKTESSTKIGILLIDVTQQLVLKSFQQKLVTFARSGTKSNYPATHRTSRAEIKELPLSIRVFRYTMIRNTNQKSYISFD